jgi:hypothetical protein
MPNTWRTKIVRSQLVLSLITLFAPDLMVLVASAGWERVCYLTILLDHVVASSKSERRYSLSHGFLLGMGGICLKSPSRRSLIDVHKH